jgi:hypothetical protein
MGVTELVERMKRENSFSRVVNNPRSMFGTRTKRYLGAELLPEVKKRQNKYRETGRTIVAKSGTRYSPVQIQGGNIVGSFDVELGHSDTGSMFTGEEYDALLDMLADAGVGEESPEAVRTMLDWSDTTLNLPLVEFNEKQRWEAIVDSVVPIRGDDNYTEDVELLNPTGHRVAAGDLWSDDTYDPYDDIMAGIDFMHGKGYEISRIISGRPVLSKLSNNAKIQARVGRLSVMSGVVTGLPARVEIERLNQYWSQDGIPPAEEYNLQYYTNTGSEYFLKRDVFVMVATTGRDVELDFGDSEPIPLRDTLGYTGIGRPQGISAPGRHIVVKSVDEKPISVQGQSWQCSFPVITEPEAIYIITGIG